MRTFLSRLQLATASLLFLVTVSFAPVALARDNGSQDASDSRVHITTKPNTETENHAHDLTEQFKKDGQAELETERKTVKADKTREQRQKVCEVRQTSVKLHMNRDVSRAAAYKTRFDNIFARAKAFHDSKGLNTPDYDSLVATVTTDQANADASITALKALNAAIDCSTKDSAATTVSAFRAGVKNTRDSLKQYRSDLVKLVQAIKQSASTNNSNQ